MNNGLKSYVKTLSYSLNDYVKVIVDPNYNNSNLYFEINVFNSLQQLPLSFTLYYNFQNTLNSYFGSYFKSNYDITINDDSSNIYVYDKDGSTSIFNNINYVYKNSDTSYTISKTDLGDGDYEYNLCDKYGNTIYYHSYDYPNKIITNNNEEITVNIPYYIDNNKGVRIEYTISDGLVTKLALYHKYVSSTENELYQTASFSYTNNILSSIEVRNSNDNIIKNISITVNDAYIIIKDNLINKYYKVTISNNKINKIYNEHSVCLLSLTYNDSITTIKEKYSNITYYKYDSNNLLLLECNNRYLFKGYYYNLKNKLLLNSSQLLNKTKIDNNDLFSNKYLSNYTLDSGEITQDEMDDIVLHNYIGYSYKYRLTSITKISNIEEILINPNEVITLICFVKVIGDGYLKISLGSKNDCSSITYTNRGTDYDLITLSYNVINGLSNVEVVILANNVTAYLSDINVVKSGLNNDFNYDDYRNIVLIKNGKEETKLNYNTNNQVTKITDENQVEEISYSSRKKISSIKKTYGNTINYSYDDSDNLILEETSNRTSTLKLKKSYTYDDYTNLIESTDINNNKETRTYTIDKLISLLNNNLNTKLEYTYYDNELIKKILSSDNTNEESINYTYDDYQNITKVECNGEVYKFSYDSKHRLWKIKLNDITIMSYTYNAYDDVSTYTHYNIKYKYYYNNYGLIKKLSYYNDNTLIAIYSIEYDNENNITSVTDSINNLEYIFTYDINNNIVNLTLNEESIEKINIDYDYNDNTLELEKYKDKYYLYQDITKSKKINIELLEELLKENGYYTAFYLDDNNLNGSEKTFYSNITDVTKEKILPYLRKDDITTLTYNILNEGGNNFNLSFYFLVSSNSDGVLVEAGSHFKLYIEGGILKADVYSNGECSFVSFSTNIEVNKLNYIDISIRQGYDDDEEYIYKTRV